MNSQREAVIKNWMHTITSDGGVARYDHLHLDCIDPDWKAKPFWFDAAGDSLQVAFNMRRDLLIDLPLAIAFSLNDSDTNPCNRQELEAQMDWTPPALYLFEKGSELWRNDNSADPNVTNFHATEGDPSIFGPPIGRAYFVTFVRTDTAEKHRSLIIAV